MREHSQNSKTTENLLRAGTAASIGVLIASPIIDRWLNPPSANLELTKETPPEVLRVEPPSTAKSFTYADPKTGEVARIILTSTPRPTPIESGPTPSPIPKSTPTPVVVEASATSTVTESFVDLKIDFSEPTTYLNHGLKTEPCNFSVANFIDCTKKIPPLNQALIEQGINPDRIKPDNVILGVKAKDILSTTLNYASLKKLPTNLINSAFGCFARGLSFMDTYKDKNTGELRYAPALITNGPTTVNQVNENELFNLVIIYDQQDTIAWRPVGRMSPWIKDPSLEVAAITQICDNFGNCRTETPPSIPPKPTPRPAPPTATPTRTQVPPSSIPPAPGGGGGPGPDSTPTVRPSTTPQTSPETPTVRPSTTAQLSPETPTVRPSTTAQPKPPDATPRPTSGPSGSEIRPTSAPATKPNNPAPTAAPAAPRATAAPSR